jgi:ABC-type antimicrobial peptide transport system permease subunit
MTKQKTSRDPLRRRVLGLLLHRGGHITLAGDFEEIYSETVRERGAFSASIWFWGQVLRSIPSFFSNSLFWSVHMFKNYFKVAFRNLKRHKGYSFINITGLAIGMACCLLISLWVLDELSFNRFHAHADQLYRVEFDQNYSGKLFHVTVSPYPMAQALEAEIPEIEHAVRTAGMGELLVRYGDKILYQDGIMAVDPAYLEIFTFPLVKGDSSTALSDPLSMIVSEELAAKYFGDEDPLGQTLTIDTRHTFRITGVMKNIPQNSDFRFKMLLSFKFLEDQGYTNDSWDSNNIPTYIKLRGDASAAQVTAKITELNARNRDTEDLTFSLMPLARIHLYSHFGFDTGPRASQYVYIFSVIAFFVLLIACINFMNLSTARSAKRAKEVGIRKVVGAVRGEITRQFYGESLLFTLISLVIALGIVVVALPLFNSLTGKSISLNLFSYWELLGGLAGVALVTGLISGSYPALFLGSFQPIRTLRGKLRSGPKSVFFRRALVVVQFTLSISLIIGTGVVYSQLNFLKSKKLGYEKEHTVYLPMRGVDRSLYGRLKSELKRNPDLLGVSGARHRPSAIGSNTDSARWEGRDPEIDVSTYMTQVDYDFFETMGINLVEGRSFSQEFSTDRESAFIINEELVKVMGVESAVNLRFGFGNTDGQVIGIVRNFHFLSLKRNIEPLVITLNPDSINYVMIRLSSQDIPASLAFIEETWKRVVPNFPFEFRFMNEDFDALYRGEERMGDILKYFAGLAVFIACLGLLGLASFAAEQRTKEIGIRKVLGASSYQITALIYKEFIILLGAANLVAWPVSYLVMRGWLQDFAYRTGISVFIFVIAALAAVLSAFLTVGFQALKASRANPVKALRYE